VVVVCREPLKAVRSRAVTQTDEYFDLPSLPYSTSTSLGTENTDFYRTRYGYGQSGRQERVRRPTVTIERTDAGAAWLDRYGYTGREWQSDAGLSYNRARFRCCTSRRRPTTRWATSRQ
jgi:hypothetical protein